MCMCVCVCPCVYIYIYIYIYIYPHTHTQTIKIVVALISECQIFNRIYISIDTSITMYRYVTIAVDEVQTDVDMRTYLYALPRERNVLNDGSWKSLF
jgi:hypothetical protein